MSRIKSLKISPRLVPAALLVLCITAFGLLIPKLGVYWDDWEIIFVLRQYGVAEFLNYFAGERPLAAWTYFLFGPILGANPLYWHILSLLIRWLAVVAFWWFFTRLWPSRRRAVTYASFIFAIYPLFLWQPIAISFHQHWMAFLLYFFSLGAMFQAVHSQRRFWLWMSLSILALFFNLATLEYFVGVELLRPLFLWIIFKSLPISNKKRIQKTVLHWLPYLAVLAAFTAWRVAYSIQNPDSANRPELLYNLFSQPLSTLVQFVQMVLQDLIYILASCWYVTLDPSQVDFTQMFNNFVWVMVVLGGTAAAFFLSKLDFSSDMEQSPACQPTPISEMALVGGLSILLGGLPIWITGRQAALNGMYSDRFAMVCMFGAGLLIAAILEWITERPLPKAVIIGVFIGLAIGINLRTANDYRWSWNTQERVYWNLFWRAPSIQPETAILTDGDLFNYVRPTFSINVLYLQAQDTKKMPYWHYLLNRGLTDNPDKLISGRTFSGLHREFVYSSDSRNSLILFYHPPETNCLWVLSPEDTNDPVITKNARLALPVSNLSRIGPEPVSSNYPPVEIFGAEPAHDWCYYYEKAELARQLEDWKQVTAIGDAALEQGFTPEKSASDAPHEWLPMIEGYARGSQWEKARQLTFQALQQDERYDLALCDLWREVKSTATAPEVTEIWTELGCKK